MESDATCSFCRTSTKIVRESARTDARICDDCVQLALDIISMDVTCAARLPAIPVESMTDEQRQVIEEKQREAIRIADEIRKSMNRAGDPMDWYRCSFCGAHRMERAKLVSALTDRVFICDRCASTQSTPIA